jgi:putative heme-binding domain-containing protein
MKPLGLLPKPLVLAVLFGSLCLAADAAPAPLFDGKTFQGWEGETAKTWRVENGEIVAGVPDAKAPRNEFLATTRSYGNFDLSLQFKRGKNNCGVQFRSQRVPNHHEVIGYQADLAPGLDGGLYDESRRRRFLARPARELIAHISPDDWHRYRIRAEGDRIRIWIGDVLTVDYTETDPAIPRDGIIALQIHSGATEVRYKDVVLEELPADAPRAQAFTLGAKDMVALIGGANMERTRFHPFLQTRLLASGQSRPQRVRNLAWEGDTAYEQARDVNFPSIQSQLDQLGATVVFSQFGQMESLQGVARLPDFLGAYEKLLGQIHKSGRRLVLVSPTPFEKASLAQYPDLTPHNAVLERYVAALRELAEKRGFAFVDLFHPFAGGAGLTENGVHLTEKGHERVAQELAGQLGVASPAGPIPGTLGAAVRELERLWFDYWRPMNWAFLEGDRKSVAFSHDWKPSKGRLFPREMKAFEPILETADANIARALAGRPLEPVPEHSSAPVEPPSLKAETPDEELATLNVHKDYQVNLFASEKDGIGKVVQIRWDERGRLWALCIPDYPQVQPGAKPRNRLVILEDTDHDGRADKSVVFADELEMPLGFELGDGGVYLATSSTLWFLRDSTGGDRADQRRLVLGGFGTGDTHQTINSLSWGFGGELWFTQGHSIYSRVETPSGVERHDRAGLWRFRPRTGKLDTFFDKSSAGANNWGVLTDRFGQVFHKEGAGNGGFYSVPGLTRGNTVLNSQNLMLFRSRDAKTVGFDMVGTRHFPDELQGAVVIGGVYNNNLQIHRLERDSQKFSTQQEPQDIISTKNPAFRPCDVRFGPDGAIYFADWYNVIVGHYQASYRHPDRDTVHGRIWRVTRKDRALVQPPKLSGATVPELLEQLDSPERWVSYQAKRLLIAQEPRAAVAALDRWVATLQAGDPKGDYRRLQALSLYEAHETPRPELLKSLLRANDSRIRAYATRALSNWARNGALPGALELLEPQVADTDWMVRLEAVVAASYLETPAAAPIALRALDGAPFHYLEHALVKSLSALKPLWTRALDEGRLTFAKDSHLLFALRNGHQPQSRRIIRERIESGGLAPAEKGEWLAALAALGSPEDAAFVLGRGSKDPAVLDALIAAGTAKKPQPSEALTGELRALLSGTDKPLRERAAGLVGKWKVQALEGALAATARDEGADPDFRKAAVFGLGDLGGEQNALILGDLVASSRAPQVRSAAVQALVVANPQEAAKLSLKTLESVSTSDAAKPVLAGILQRAEGERAFRSAVPGNLSAGQALLTLRALNEMGRSDRAVARALMNRAGVSDSVPEYTGEYVKAVAARSRTAGDAAEGRKVFEQSGCMACHAVNNVGGKIGPDLSALSRGLPLDMIVTEVVWPSINVKEGFEAASATLKDGTVVSGFKQLHTESVLGIRDMNTGEVRTIQRSEAAQMKVGGTVMPEGLTGALSEKQLADLIRYLGELGK